MDINDKRVVLFTCLICKTKNSKIERAKKSRLLIFDEVKHLKFKSQVNPEWDSSLISRTFWCSLVKISTKHQTAVLGVVGVCVNL